MKLRYTISCHYSWILGGRSKILGGWSKILSGGTFCHQATTKNQGVWDPCPSYGLMLGLRQGLELELWLGSARIEGVCLEGLLFGRAYDAQSSIQMLFQTPKNITYKLIFIKVTWVARITNSKKVRRIDSKRRTYLSLLIYRSIKKN